MRPRIFASTSRSASGSWSATHGESGRRAKWARARARPRPRAHANSLRRSGGCAAAAPVIREYTFSKKRGTPTRIVGRTSSASLATLSKFCAYATPAPQARTLHEGETYFVRKLDLEQKTAFVERREVDYYTQAVLDTSIRVRGERQRRDWRGESVALGDVTYSWQT